METMRVPFSKLELIIDGFNGTQQCRDEPHLHVFFHWCQVCPYIDFNPAQVLPLSLKAVDWPSIGWLRVSQDNLDQLLHSSDLLVDQRLKPVHFHPGQPNKAAHILLPQTPCYWQSSCIQDSFCIVLHSLGKCCPGFGWCREKSHIGAHLTQLVE